MKASDLHLPALLEMNPEGGPIRFNDQRMLLWDADAFGGLRKELVESLGLDSARPILKRFGFANGFRDARMTQKLMQWDNDAEWWRNCPALQHQQGKAVPDVQHLRVDREAGIFELEVQWTHSYEAEQHARLFGEAVAPVCWTLAGFASGFASALMGEECIVIETECTAMGAACCRVIGKTRSAWGSPGPDLASDYQAPVKPAPYESHHLVSRSRCMDGVTDLCRTAAKLDAVVLLCGEMGVGKSHLARLVHSESAHHQEPFMVVNCAALPETLLESELFGHMQDAFVGANQDKIGAMVAVGHGTVYLEEISKLSPASQLKLLQALQDREVRPLGGNAPHTIHARVVVSTHHDLAEKVSDGTFRADLLQRLSLVLVKVPPLRSRREDILPLARKFLAGLCLRMACTEKRFSVQAAQTLDDYMWPGNLRELENVIEGAVLLSGENGIVECEHLAISLGSPRMRDAVDDAEIVPIAEIERRYVLEVLERYNGNRTRTAKALGIGANTLWRKLKGWGVPPARGETSYP